MWAEQAVMLEYTYGPNFSLKISFQPVPYICREDAFRSAMEFLDKKEHSEEVEGIPDQLQGKENMEKG